MSAQRTRRDMKRLVLLILLAGFLSSCMPLLSADTSLSLSGKQHWSALINIKLPSISSIIPGTDAEVTQWMNDQMRQFGIQARVSGPRKDRNGNLVYSAKVQGQGYSQLNQVFSTFCVGQVFTVDPDHEGRVRFYCSPLSLEMVDFRLTLHAGRIISSNGKKISPWAVRWENGSGPMEAVVQEGSGFYSLLIVSGGLIILVLGTVVTVRKVNSHDRSKYPSKMKSFERQKRVCSFCHRTVPREAWTCPFCGRRLR